MKKNETPVIELPAVNTKSAAKPVEIHNGKIVPQKENGLYMMKQRSSENEWQQEYFIIYNSYMIEQVDN